MGANYANLFEVIAGDVGASDDVTRISELCGELDAYLEPGQVEEIYRAYLVGAAAHEGQSRVSGEPYISHPVAVARILAEMRMDSRSIIAAILHDVIEDTPTLKEQIASQFGDEVAELVDGVSKLTQIDFRSKAEAQAENFRKMMLAMVKDIRVIIIKLADRLHNMRTLDAMPPHKRRRPSRIGSVYSRCAMNCSTCRSRRPTRCVIARWKVPVRKLLVIARKSSTPSRRLFVSA